MSAAGAGALAAPVLLPEVVLLDGRGLHSFPFQLNFSSSVHRVTRLSS